MIKIAWHVRKHESYREMFGLSLQLVYAQLSETHHSLSGFHSLPRRLSQANSFPLMRLWSWDHLIWAILFGRTSSSPHALFKCQRGEEGIFFQIKLPPHTPHPPKINSATNFSSFVPAHSGAAFYKPFTQTVIIQVRLLCLEKKKEWCKNQFLSPSIFFFGINSSNTAVS